MAAPSTQHGGASKDHLPQEVELSSLVSKLELRSLENTSASEGGIAAPSSHDIIMADVVHLKESETHKMIEAQAQEYRLRDTASKTDSRGQQPCVRSTLSTVTNDALANSMRTNLHGSNQPKITQTSAPHSQTANATVQNSGTRVGLMVTATYCDICQHDFITNEALQMHCINSKSHQGELKGREAMSKRVATYCHICQREFPSNEALQMHHSNSKSHQEKLERREAEFMRLVFYCDLCQRDFSSDEALQQHFEGSPAHQNEPTRPETELNTAVPHCDICQRKFISDEALQLHVSLSNKHQQKLERQETKLNTAATYCDICQHESINNEALQVHVNSSKKHQEKLERQEAEMRKALTYCNLCQRDFPNEEAFQQHVNHSPAHQKGPGRREYGTKIAVFQCRSCQRVFNSNEALQMHFNDSPAHQSERKRRGAELKKAVTYCNLCQRDFANEEAFQQHVNNSPAHQNEPRKRGDESKIPAFYCRLCQRVFHSNEALQMHVDNSPVHESEPKRRGAELKKAVTYCGLCQRDFANHEALQQHLNNSQLHQSVPKSREAFTQADKVRKTIDQASSIGAELKMALAYCDICQRDFPNDEALQMHVENSKSHQKELRKRKAFTQTDQVRDTRRPSSYRNEAHAENRVQTPTYSFMDIDNAKYKGIDHSIWKTSEQAGKTKGFSMASLNGLQVRPQNQQDSISTVDMTINLQQLDIIHDRQAKPSDTQQKAQNNTSHPQHRHNHWAVIPSSEQLAVLEAVSKLCHSREDLSKINYILHEYGPDDMDGIRRCSNCYHLQKTILKRGRTNCVFHLKGRHPASYGDGSRTYRCCGNLDQGCVSLPAHDYQQPDHRLATKYRQFAPTPPWSPQRSKRRAVALDCEMAGVQGGMSELIRLCMIDFLTGEILINSLVRPSKKITDWRTRISGVTAQDMDAATARGQTLNGWEEARRELWKHIDADTILIGQSLQHDLDVLRLIHPRIVDSAILTRNAVGPNGTRQWGLKVLCSQLLGITIQSSVEQRGHDCLEDALAAREVVLWCIWYPERLNDWGRLKKEEEEQEKEERRKQKEEKEKEREEKEQERQKQEKKKKDKKENQKAKQSVEKTYGTHILFDEDDDEIMQ
ncbi:MAG: hypothetical protein M1816_001958 [Peltula sp. TS41687]|nr:MAG: hypothetical protein M1816_001958 [Peltula sp. TS41687]